MTVNFVNKVALAAVALLLVAVPAASAAPRSVPHGFFGVHWTPELTAVAERGPGLPVGPDGQLRRGVGPRRLHMDRAPSRAATAPIDFSRTDALVRRAALHSIDLLPVVTDAPRWARAYRFAQVPAPRSRHLARYVGALVDRYGSKGTSGASTRSCPSARCATGRSGTSPTCGSTGMHRPTASGATRVATAGCCRPPTGRSRSRDRSARVVLAGITQRAWEEIDEMYARGGIKGHFDVAALQIFPQTVRRSVLATRLFRQALRRHGDAGKPIFLTEISWPASKGKTRRIRYLAHETPRSMAFKLARA